MLSEMGEDINGPPSEWPGCDRVAILLEMGRAVWASSTSCSNTWYVICWPLHQIWTCNKRRPLGLEQSAGRGWLAGQRWVNSLKGLPQPGSDVAHVYVLSLSWWTKYMGFGFVAAQCILLVLLLNVGSGERERKGWVLVDKRRCIFRSINQLKDWSLVAYMGLPMYD